MPLTLYSYHEVQMLLPDAVPHDLPLPVAFTRHGQPLYCAISIDAVSAAKVAAELEAERVAHCGAVATYRAHKSSTPFDNQHITSKGLDK